MLPIRITRRASAQLQEAASWWKANRLAAPEALEEELRQAFRLISQQPDIGAIATNPRLSGVRRIHLSRVRYYLYYRAGESGIEVLALWHSSRGEAPVL